MGNAPGPPKLDEVTAAFIAAAARFLDGVRARDEMPVKEEILDSQAHLRALTRAGLVDLIRDGESPLDFATVERHALHADLGAGSFSIAGLRTVVAMKRLADRPRDRNDLLQLEEEHGSLPVDPLPKD